MSSTDDMARQCPWFCLTLETIICPGFASSSTRLYVQDERQIVTDPCDNRIIRFNNLLQLLRCICDVLAICFGDLRPIAELIRLFAELVYLITQACIQAQTHLELERHPTAMDYGAAVVVQPKPQALPQAQGYPPPGGYPPQGYPANPQGYGAAYQNQPPAYPAQAYTPQHSQV